MIDRSVCPTWRRKDERSAGHDPVQHAKEIQAALDGMQADWNHHDMNPFVAYMTHDVARVNVVGMWWRGKAQVFKAHDTMDRTIFKDRNLQDSQEPAMRAIVPAVVVVTSIIPANPYTAPGRRVTPANRNVLTETFMHRTIQGSRAAPDLGL